MAIRSLGHQAALLRLSLDQLLNATLADTAALDLEEGVLVGTVVHSGLSDHTGGHARAFVSHLDQASPTLLLLHPYYHCALEDSSCFFLLVLYGFGRGELTDEGEALHFPNFVQQQLGRLAEELNLCVLGELGWPPGVDLLTGAEFFDSQEFSAAGG